MNRITVGDKAPDFSQPDQHGEQLSLSDFKGKKAVVLFFYPADESPICTKESSKRTESGQKADRKWTQKCPDGSDKPC